jgi:23S rRNA (guanosine2251-2'-O)-methyltransferase
MGYFIIGLDSEGESEMGNLGTILDGPIALVLGAEGPGLRHKTKDICDVLARITPTKNFGSLNVSNAAAVALYASKKIDKT